MKPFALALLLTLAVATAAPSQPADPTLYRTLGERPGIERIVADLVRHAAADARIGHTFADTKLDELRKQLADQFCALAGGPCVYEGANMKDAHAETRIGKADFLRLVELLQDAMDRERIPFAAQNRLLALLAPMHRDIVNQR